MAPPGARCDGSQPERHAPPLLAAPSAQAGEGRVPPGRNRRRHVMTELLRALALVAEPPSEASARVCTLLELDPPTGVEFTDFFTFAQPPYASLYLGADGLIGGEARDRIAGFWRAVGVAPPPEPDHLATMLGG